MLHAANTLEQLVGRIEQEKRLDAPAAVAREAVTRSVPNRTVRDLLAGTWLGHPVHPMLTDLPIGFWTSAFVLDLVGGRRARPAAELLVAAGVITAVPTVASGAVDWSDTSGTAQRVGLVHAAANLAAVGLYAWSWRARRGGRHAQGLTLGFLGSAAATFGGYLGGHLLARRGVGVDRAGLAAGPGDWTFVATVDDISEAPTVVELGSGPPSQRVTVVVLRRAGRILAFSETCPHRGAPLATGKFDAETVTCPWHGSRFRLDDGGLIEGPSAMPLPCYETRLRDRRVEVRARSRGGARRR